MISVIYTLKWPQCFTDFMISRVDLLLHPVIWHHLGVCFDSLPHWQHHAEAKPGSQETSHASLLAFGILTPPSKQAC